MEPPNESDELPSNTDQQLQSLLVEFQDIFKEPNGLPPKRTIAHEIRTSNDHRPHAQAPFKMSALEKDQLLTQLKKMINEGIIRPTKGPYAAPVLLIRKPDNSLRFTVDYRMLNRFTIPNIHPMPVASDISNKLKDANQFSKLDLKDGFFQIRMESQSIHKTGFSHLGTSNS